MLTIQTGTSVPGVPEFRVVKGGDYEETDLVEVEHVKNPGKAYTAYQAFFIANGRTFDELLDSPNVKEDPATNPDVKNLFDSIDATTGKLKSILGVK